MAHHGNADRDNAGRGDLGKLWAMIRDIDICMMTTLDQGQLRARPMWALKDEDGDALLFFTWGSAHKTDEIAEDARVCCAFADPKGQDYVSVSGTAFLSDDRARIHELWAEPMRTWFPKGKDDPDLQLVVLPIETAEYWDSPSAAMVHLYGYAKAALTGKSPHPGETGKVDLRDRH